MSLSTAHVGGKNNTLTLDLPPTQDSSGIFPVWFLAPGDLGDVWSHPVTVANEGFSSGFPTKNVIILVETGILGGG